MKQIIANKYDFRLSKENLPEGDKQRNERGSAIVIALFIMILLMGFVALAISRTTNETIASANDAAESRAFEASHASLEIMTQNFDKIFDIKLNPDKNDFYRIEAQFPPDFTDDYEFRQSIRQTQKTQQVVMTGQRFQGLNALRDEWQIDTTAVDRSSGVQVALRRKFFNNRIPIFQFGIFYDDDLEFHPGPRFDFGGRVHSNGSMFMMAGTGLYFSSKVTADDHIFTDVARNGTASTNWGEKVYIKNASGKYVQLKANMGSVLQNPVNGSPETDNPEYPRTYKSGGWKTNEGKFQGNLLAYQEPLDLPLKLNSVIKDTKLDYVELIKRGKAVGDLYNNGTLTVPVTDEVSDDLITARERYFNKTGIRISLADTKAKLPGCASGTLQTPVSTDCGIRLDGNSDGKGGYNIAQSRGYTPRPMTDGYQATRINGERFFTGREIWIKIETIAFDVATNTFKTKDITEDILSLGVTTPPIYVANKFSVNGYGTSGVDGKTACINTPSAKDCRSVINLQRFIFGGAKVANTVVANDRYITNNVWNSVDYNYILAAEKAAADVTPVPVDDADYGTFTGDHQDHWKKAVVGDTAKERWVAPFPINMFDTREGLYHEGSDFNISSEYGKKVPWNGVISMLDIDVGNLKAFLDGSLDTKMPTGTPFAAAAGRALKASDIPDVNGWVLYVSDRRRDGDFDGEYDMEDIYGGNDNTMQPGEDINNNNILDRDYLNEAVKYKGLSASESPDIAAVLDHQYYRRGVRLVNAVKLPGKYDEVAPAKTKGFSVASENGVYVLGNYNATGIASIGTPTKSTDYLPQDEPDHIPASIVADAVTILSNNWTDARSFASPFTLANRNATETTIRFAMLAGDARSSFGGTPNQGGGDPRLTGGVHNFKRFLETWSDDRLNYSGSLINLFNSHNNNGAFKCCGIVYSPPTRNWIFDSSFLDPNRLPPGTPYFQSIQLTGFQRLN